MDQPESKSEVARIMRQIDLELEAAKRGMYGFASTARHDAINARMQRGGERILQLIDEGKHEEAQALMNADDWEGKGRENDEEKMTDGIIEGVDGIRKGIEEDKTGIQKDESKTRA